MSQAQIITFFEPSSGRAVVSMDEHTFHLLEVKEDGTVGKPRTLPTTFNMNAWVDIRHCEILRDDIGEFPFEPLQTYMLTQTHLHQLISWFERSLNRTRTPIFRSRSATLFEQRLTQASPEVLKAFEIKARDILEHPDVDKTVSPFQPGSNGEALLRKLTTLNPPLHEGDCLDKVPDIE